MLLLLKDRYLLAYDHVQHAQILQHRQFLRRECHLHHDQRFYLDKFSYRVGEIGLNHQLQIDHRHVLLQDVLKWNHDRFLNYRHLFSMKKIEREESKILFGIWK